MEQKHKLVFCICQTEMQKKRPPAKCKAVRDKGWNFFNWQPLKESKVSGKVKEFQFCFSEVASMLDFLQCLRVFQCHLVGEPFPSIQSSSRIILFKIIWAHISSVQNLPVISCLLRVKPEVLPGTNKAEWSEPSLALTTSCSYLSPPPLSFSSLNIQGPPIITPQPPIHSP
jgi:hypothetical protein